MDPTLAALLGVIAGMAGGFLSAYATQKGKNKAMAQDIAEITRLTKDIEAKISNEMWIGQRSWDLKRTAAFELAKEMGSFQEAVLKIYAAWAGRRDSRPEDIVKADQRIADAFDAYTARTSDLWRAKMVAELVLGENVVPSVHGLEQTARQILTLTHPPVGTAEDFSKVIGAMADTCKKVLILMREDLGRP